MPSRLSARPIVNFQNVNSFKYANQWEISAGNTNTLYFQLVDLDQCGLRYLPGGCVEGVPLALRVNFPSIDCSQVLTLLAQQNTCDGSIWSVAIPSISTPQTGNVMFQLFEGNNIQSFAVLQMLVVNYPNSGSDGTLPDNTFFF
jgi:hypothetical protein